MMTGDGIPKKGRSGKWLVLIIVGGGLILAVVGSRYTKWRTLMPDPATSQPQNVNSP